MDESEFLAERFEANRAHLRAVAYRMLGSLSEAEDAVQETWFRLSRSDISDVRNLGGWLTTVVGRVCLDMLRSRTSRREEPLEVYVPDPIVGRPDGSDPEQEALLADSVGRLRAGGCVEPDPRCAGGGRAGPHLPAGREVQPAGPRQRTPGCVTAPDGQPLSIMSFTVADGKIVEIDILADVDRLGRLDLPTLD